VAESPYPVLHEEAAVIRQGMPGFSVDTVQQPSAEGAIHRRGKLQNAILMKIQHAALYTPTYIEL
jgi:hypothetical protein